MPSTKNYSNDIEKLKTAICNADAVLIGAGAGLSTSAGFYYTGERFKKYFADFEAKYHFHDMYSGGFYPYPNQEEFWAYWSRYVYINRYLTPPKNVYNLLYNLVKDKEYFVLTTNVDHCFQKAGFSKNRLFYTQGDYGLFQCSKPCHNKTYDNEELIKEMVTSQKNMRIPSKLIPHCPKCGREMAMNLRSDDTFVQEQGWYEASKKYEDFLKKYKNTKIVYLELGVGYNTPIIIKYSFWKKTLENPQAIYACINYGQIFCPDEIQSQTICINEDIGKVLAQMLKDTHA